MDVTQLFNVTLPAALEANAVDARTVGAKFQFNIGGAGEWHMDLTKTGPSCKPGTEKSDVTISISDKDFVSLLENPKGKAMGMFFSGKLKVAGNQMLGMKLEKILSYVK
jgi:putative sterol carrier protein